MKGKMNASVHFDLRGSASADCGGSGYVTGEWTPGRMEVQCLLAWAFHGIITAELLLYHAHVASLRRRAGILWRAVSDGTCQLYHKSTEHFYGIINPKQALALVLGTGAGCRRLRRLKVCDREVNPRSHGNSVPAITGFLWHHIRKADMMPLACRGRRDDALKFCALPSLTAHVNSPLNATGVFGPVFYGRDAPFCIYGKKNFI